MAERDENATQRGLLATIGVGGCIAGAILVGWGLIGFGAAVMSDDPEGAPMARYFTFLAVGAVALVVGFVLLNLVVTGNQHCTECGHQETPGAKFCSECGKAMA